ncbi:Protein CBG23017 [Caenorhabditis briggsae]|uniref:Protein CBG23017 n=1 Tax=Caenorhabditis briggsae TaxID=6238 RepID=A8Y3F7_CAEBR|nr:Protein CBG23017 [Caenorhabditis briggsae]CAP39426.2 Protein CBG23017 [Caenorhabditis briggsae]
MQNFGGPPQGGGPGQGQMYGGPPGGPAGGPQQGPPMQQQQSSLFNFQLPQPAGFSSQHLQQYKHQLHQFQTHRTNALNAAVQAGQLNQSQFAHEIHIMNEKITQAYNKYQLTARQMHHQQQQQQQQGQGSSSSTGPNNTQGQMPPPMAPAEKKRMMEMQKQRTMMAQQQAAQAQQQQQQQQGLRFPQNATLQQQQQMRLQYQQQQQQAQQAAQQAAQQNSQNQGYRGMGGGPGGPGYPPQGMPMGGGSGGMGGPGGIAGGPMSVQSQGGPGSNMQPQTPQSHGPASVSNPASQQQQQGHPGQHLQQQQSQQPHDAFQQPSAPAPPPAPPAEKTEQVKYQELLKELRAQYYDVLIGMQKRQVTQKGMVPMIQILDGERQVPYEQLKGLAPSLQRLMIRDCPTFPLLEELRRIVFKKKEDREKAITQTFSSERDPTFSAEKASARLRAKCQDDPCGVAPWSSVKHLAIRVPDAIRILYQKPKVETPDDVEEKKTLKRARGVEDDEMEMDIKAKRIKGEEATTPERDEDTTMIPEQFLIKTVFDTRQPWIIPPKARQELLKLSNWTVDDQSLPSSSKTPFIIICVKSPYLLVSPLRVCLPHSYPSTPVSIQFDKTFPEDSEYGAALQQLYEKHLSTKPAVRSLTDFVEAWQSACEQYLVFMPKYQADSSPEQLSSQQSQKTPEMPNYGRTVAAAGPAVAQLSTPKGIVI